MTYRPCTSNMSTHYGTSEFSGLRQSTNLTDEGRYHSSRTNNSCEQTINDPWRLMEIFAKIDLFTGDPKKFRGWMATVEQLIDMFNISEQEMLHYLICLLRGDAREWWVRMMAEVDSWAEAKSDLKDRFGFHPENIGNNPQPTKTTYPVQRYGQRVTDYIDSMERYFNQLQRKPLVLQKVNIVYRGFHPVLRNFLDFNGVQDLSELSFIAKEVERCTIAAGKWPATEGSGFNGQRHRMRRKK